MLFCFPNMTAGKIQSKETTTILKTVFLLFEYDWIEL